MMAVTLEFLSGLSSNTGAEQLGRAMPGLTNRPKKRRGIEAGEDWLDRAKQAHAD